jgi:hypothetical protein
MPIAGLWRGLAGRPQLTFGTARRRRPRRGARLGVEDGAWATRFDLDTPQGAADPPRPARPAQRHERAGAAAAALACGATLAAGRRGPGAGAARGRPAAAQGRRGGAWLVDDSYNANPSSAIAGLDVLAALARRALAGARRHGRARRPCEAAHAEVGRHARAAGVTRLDAVGEHTRHAVEAFGNGARWHPDAPALVHAAAPGAAAGRHRAGEGLAGQPPRARRRRARGPAGARGRRNALRARRMLLELFAWLDDFYGGFRVFGYLTLRAILAALTALAISLLVGPPMIRRLAQKQIGQVVRDDGPQTHLGKRGTPTMGGTLILVAIALSTLLWADLGNRFVWIVLAVTLAFGVIGFYDDYLKLVIRDPRGLAARWKYFWQSVAGSAPPSRCGPRRSRRRRPRCSCRSSRTSCCR